MIWLQFWWLHNIKYVTIGNVNWYHGHLFVTWFEATYEEGLTERQGLHQRVQGLTELATQSRYLPPRIIYLLCDTKKTIYCKAVAIVQSILSVYHINVPYSQWALWRHDNFVDFVIVLDWVCIRLLFKDLFEQLVGRFLNQLHDVHAQGVSVLLQKSWQNTALSDQRQFAF